MVFEVVFLYGFAMSLAAWLFLLELRALWQDWRRERYVTRKLYPLEYADVRRAEAVLGEPSEVIPGVTGRLYVWNAARVPGGVFGRHRLVVTMTVGETGRVQRASFQTR